MGTTTPPSASRFAFTMARLAALPVPAAGRDRYYDTKTRWLTVIVSPEGRKTYFLLRKVNGRVRQIALGVFPEMNVEQAREAATAEAAKVAAGVDPVAERRAMRAETTLQALFNRYLAEHALPHKRSATGDEEQFDRYVGALAKRRLSDITHDTVRQLHTRVGKDHGHYSANRLLALISSIFNFATRTGYTGPNPARGVKRFREQSRERFLSADELPRFISAVEAEAEPFNDFFMLAILCGPRRGNLQAMRWEDLDLNAGVWSIPAEQFKSGKPHKVYLPAPAVAILQKRLKAAPDLMKGTPTDDPRRAYVFPGRRSGAKVPHLAEPKIAWSRIIKRAELKDLRMHDLRRTLGSWQAATGASLPVIGKTLGHANQATTQIYARLSLDPVRESVDTATAAMLTAGRKATPTPPDGQEGDGRPDGGEEPPAF